MYEIIYIPNFRKIVNKSIRVINTLKGSLRFDNNVELSYILPAIRLYFSIMWTM